MGCVSIYQLLYWLWKNGCRSKYFLKKNCCVNCCVKFFIYIYIYILKNRKHIFNVKMQYF